VEPHDNFPHGLENLQAIEQLEREWWWLQGALNATAELRAGQAEAHRIISGRSRRRRGRWTGGACKSPYGLPS
jgi:hypothetical protein